MSGNPRDTLKLEGEWTYRLLGAPSSIPGEGTITLPSTLDNSHKSVYIPESDNTTQLRREFSFTGEATYSKRIFIPDSWEGKSIELFLERTKPSVVYVDGEKIGENSRISSPQRYDLSKVLTPGSHKLEIKINNADSLPPIVSRSSHAASESTQTNWNGILGDIFLQSKNHFHIKNVTFKEDLLKKEIEATIFFSEKAETPMALSARLNSGNPVKVPLRKNTDKVSVVIPITAEDKLWSALHPELSILSFQINNRAGNIIDEMEITTGLRDFSSSGTSLNVNNNPVFLRGTVNAAVFPLTGHAPTDIESWMEYFKILKDYGLNHVRFHSWTPPEAAFEAADRTGFYLQTELPMWGELDRDLVFTNKFLKEDLEGILESYSLHPSLVMFSTGNELWGDISLMGEYMNKARETNPRLLSTYGSNVYLGMNGQMGGEDFIVAAKTNDEMENSIRGSVSFADSKSGGYLNSHYPNSNYNFGTVTQGITAPLISHEVGQYQSYPDFSEIEKYSGALKADNLKEFRRMAQEAGTLRKNKDFAEASGKWAIRLYKAEMEMAQRTPGLAGFQLFGIQDYPGQGTALIGILTPMMESKGFVSPEEWKQSCNDLMILAEFPAFTFTSGESVEIPVVSVNFTENPSALKKINWDTGFRNGSLDIIPGQGVIENESLFLRMPEVSVPTKYSLQLTASDVSNSYDFWVYPSKLPSARQNVTITDNLQETMSLLERGERVILCPDFQTLHDASIDPLFVNDFWNYRMYRTICDEMGLAPSPGTLGLLIDKNHPALRKFATDNHTDWQWYPIITNSRPLIIDRLPKDIDPIVEVIDNVERNFRLGLLLECNVGKGKLMILAADMKKASRYPEGKWFLQSIMEYMGDKECKPKITLTPQQVINLVTKPSAARRIKELKNETYNSYRD